MMKEIHEFLSDIRLNDIKFISKNKLVGLGNDGVYRTEDGGKELVKNL